MMNYKKVCYSWWVLSSLAMLGCTEYIHRDKLVEFILHSQDPVTGGIADRPEDLPDVFHTLFGLSGLSLLGFAGLEQIDPRYCLPVTCLRGIAPLKK
jgi:geranylgeranyl transferase type-2 subunit beta